MASQYSTILTSDSGTTVNQYDVIKYSDYENLKSKYDTLYNKVYSVPSQFYNLRVEGGGLIFFDWKYGFTGATTTGSNGCSVSADTTSDLGDYYYDEISHTVCCSRLGAKHRFYVVAESGLVEVCMMWDASNPTTHRATSTGFGTGKANTTLLCNVITNDMWPLVKCARAMNPGGHDLVSDDSALDTRWFVPSKDEMYVLVAMQYQNSSYRPSGIPQLPKLSINNDIEGLKDYYNGYYGDYYWSSSEISESEGTKSAWRGYVDAGCMSWRGKEMAAKYSSTLVRLCRTF